MVGVMRWLCEFGKIDIFTETSLLSTYLVYVFGSTYVDINDNHLPYKDRVAVKAKYICELYPIRSRRETCERTETERKKILDHILCEY